MGLGIGCGQGGGQPVAHKSQNDAATPTTLPPMMWKSSPGLREKRFLQRRLALLNGADVEPRARPVHPSPLARCRRRQRSAAAAASFRNQHVQQAAELRSRWQRGLRLQERCKGPQGHHPANEQHAESRVARGARWHPRLGREPNWLRPLSKTRMHTHKHFLRYEANAMILHTHTRMHRNIHINSHHRTCPLKTRRAPIPPDATQARRLNVALPMVCITKQLVLQIMTANTRTRRPNAKAIASPQCDFLLSV